MTAKQTQGALAPDGSQYVVLTDGAGTLSPAGSGGNANGQATMANSAPVVIASNQSAVSVTDAGLTSGTQQTKITDGTNISAVKAASTAPLATDPALVMTLSPNSPGIVALGQTTKSASVPVTVASDQALVVGQLSSYPSGATPIAATSGNVAAAVATATLAGTSSKTTYISGFSVVGSGATLGSVVVVTITNLIGSITFSYPLAAIAGALLMNTPLIISFPLAIPASATNTSIVVSCPSLGAGNTNNVVNAFGYQL